MKLEKKNVMAEETLVGEQKHKEGKKPQCCTSGN